MSHTPRRSTSSFDESFLGARDWKHVPSASSRRKIIPLIGFVIGMSSLVVAFLFYNPRAYQGAVAVGKEEQAWDKLAQTVAGNGSNMPVPTQKPKEPETELLIGQPSQRFRDNLRDDVKYITSFATAGWTNQAMSFFNLLYLSTLTDRVPVMAPFAPSHMKVEAGFLDFSEVFDLSRLSASLNKPILEWWQVKDRKSTQLDEIGCWSTLHRNEHRAVFTTTPEFLRLDVSYTPIPDDAFLPADSLFATFWGLAFITFPQYRKERMASADVEFPSPTHKHNLPPDDALACFDFPYFVAAAYPYEHDHDYSPSWRFVGKHAHWNPRLQTLAEQYLRRLFGVRPTEPIPPFITIHARRADFETSCYDVPKDECFPPLSAYARRVLEVQVELRATRGVDVTRVIVTSDESDHAWWEEVHQLGWMRVDHAAERTEEIHGIWYTTLLDMVFQSLGLGFVGTASSTMSLIAKRRVEDWHGGVARMVKWGTKDADAH